MFTFTLGFLTGYAFFTFKPQLQALAQKAKREVTEVMNGLSK